MVRDFSISRFSKLIQCHLSNLNETNIFFLYKYQTSVFGEAVVSFQTKVLIYNDNKNNQSLFKKKYTVQLKMMISTEIINLVS